MEEFKYFGIILNYNGRFHKGQLALKEQATITMYSVIGKIRKFDLPTDRQIELFNTMVIPVLTYASEIWGYFIIREVELVHLKFLKQVLYVDKKKTSNDMMYGELVFIHLKFTSRVECWVCGPVW